MDWPKLNWPKLVKSGWPKRDWPKSVPSGRTTLSKNVARALAQWTNNAQADCKSGTAGSGTGAAEHERCTHSRILKRCTEPFHRWSQLLGDGARYQPPDDIPSDDTPDTSLWFPKNRHPAQFDVSNHLCGDLSSCQLFAHEEKRVQITRIAQQWPEVLSVVMPERPPAAPLFC